MKQKLSFRITKDGQPYDKMWILTGQRDYDDRPIFIHKRIGCRIIINDANKMQQAHPDYPWYEKSLYKEKE